MPIQSRSDVPAIRVAWLAAALAIVAVPIVLQETFLSMVRQWEGSDSYAYGYLILPATLFLGWARRGQLPGIMPRATALGLFASVAAGIAWIIGYLAEVDSIQQVAAISLLGFSVWAVLGTEIARALAYPLVYLFFMAPLGGFLVSPLMEWTADFTLAATELSGVPIYRDGMFLSIPEGNFSVVEACSGLRALLVFAATGVFFAGVNFRSSRRRAIFIAISLVVPIIANGLRAYGIVMLGHISNMRWIEHHVLLGDIWFGCILLLMCLIGRRYSDLDHGATGPASRVAGIEPAGTAWPSAIAAGASVLLVILIPFSGTALEQKFDNRSSKAFPGLPMEIEPWIFSPVASPDWDPAFFNATREAAGQYQSGDALVDVHIISYTDQAEGAEMINSLNHLFDREHWRQVQERTGTMGLASGHSLPYGAVEIRSRTGSEQKRIIWYWYLVDGHPTVDPFVVKLRETINLFATQKSISSLVALSTPADDDVSGAQRSFEAFLNIFCGAAGPDRAEAPVCGR